MLGREAKRWGDTGRRRGDGEGLVLVAGPPGAVDWAAKDEKAKLSRVLSGLVVGDG